MNIKKAKLIGKTVRLELTMTDKEFEVYTRLNTLVAEALVSDETTKDNSLNIIESLGFEYVDGVLWTSYPDRLEDCYNELKSYLDRVKIAAKQFNDTLRLVETSWDELSPEEQLKMTTQSDLGWMLRKAGKLLGTPSLAWFRFSTEWKTLVLELTGKEWDELPLSNNPTQEN